MTKPIHQPRKGFTLIELLTVIAIIGILASILIPTIGSVLNNAKRTAAASNAAQIAKTYAAYSNGSTNGRNIQTTAQAGGTTNGATSGVATDIDDVAFILAQKADLNDASMWYIPADDNLGGASIPKSVIEGDTNSAAGTSTTFTAVVPKSWAFVIGLSTSAPSTTTPLLWTYGLSSATGKWNTPKSPWAGKGGHIAFLDGHVSWYDELDKTVSDESLVVYQGNPSPGTATQDITQTYNSETLNPAEVVNATGNSIVGPP